MCAQLSPSWDWSFLVMRKQHCSNSCLELLFLAHYSLMRKQKPDILLDSQDLCLQRLGLSTFPRELSVREREPSGTRVAVLFVGTWKSSEELEGEKWQLTHFLFCSPRNKINERDKLKQKEEKKMKFEYRKFSSRARLKFKATSEVGWSLEANYRVGVGGHNE